MQGGSRNPASLEQLIENQDVGLEELHPGGLALSTEFARQCGIVEGARFLEIAPGTGETACLLAADFGARLTCLDISWQLLLRTRNKARERGLRMEWVRGDAHALPFRDAHFDGVVSESALCNLDKLRALREMQRVTRPGGVVGTNDLCWRPDAPASLKQRLKELEGLEPETLEGWRALFEDAGLSAVQVYDRSHVVSAWMRNTRARMGWSGYLRVAASILRKWGLAGLRSALASERIFSSPDLGYAIVIGRKPSAS